MNKLFLIQCNRKKYKKHALISRPPLRLDVNSNKTIYSLHGVIVFGKVFNAQ